MICEEGGEGRCGVRWSGGLVNGEWIREKEAVTREREAVREQHSRPMPCERATGRTRSRSTGCERFPFFYVTYI